jgi:hypothetical protein
MYGRRVQHPGADPWRTCPLSLRPYLLAIGHARAAGALSAHGIAPRPRCPASANAPRGASLRHRSSAGGVHGFIRPGVSQGAGMQSIGKGAGSENMGTEVRYRGWGDRAGMATRSAGTEARQAGHGGAGRAGHASGAHGMRGKRQEARRIVGRRGGCDGVQGIDRRRDPGTWDVEARARTSSANSGGRLDARGTLVAARLLL